MDAPTQFELSEFEKLLEPLAVWCVRMGVGHRQFSQFMKDQFFKAACQELTQNGAQLVTDSALCLASGLHRGDVIQMRKFLTSTRQTQGIASRAYQSRISPASQVIARWLAMGWSKTIPLKGPEPSFQQLVRGTALSQNVILRDLQRRQLVQVEGHQVRLLSEFENPNVNLKSAIEHVTGALRDHLLACIENISLNTCEEPACWLEQSLNVDGLHPESVHLLHNTARKLWSQTLQTLAQQAVERSDADEPQGGQNRLRIGIYVYAEST